MKCLKFRKRKQKEYLKIQSFKERQHLNIRMSKERMINRAKDLLMNGLIKKRGLSGCVDYLIADFKKLKEKLLQS